MPARTQTLSVEKAPSMKFSTILGTLALPFLVLSAVALAGCDDPEAAAEQKEELPDIKVELPASPNFDEARAPEKWDDGDYSIFGLRLNIDDRLKEGESGQEIVLKGWVQEIYVPPVCPEGELCPPGKQPHFWITDAKDEQGKKRAMMVVNYSFPIPEWDEATLELWKDVPQVIVEVGKQYKIKGKFMRFSGSGFAHDNGLLEFISYEAADPVTGEMVWIAPPNSAWHPQTILAQEAENKEMMDKMAADAAKLQDIKAGAKAE
jgi:hypothetical protein